MLPNIKRGLLVILILWITNSCNFFNKVHISAQNFGEVIGITQNLILKFDEQLANAEDMKGWFTADFVDITPQIAGKFKWKDGKTLVFSPSESFAPATTYKLSLNDKTKNYLTTAKEVDNEPLIFSTPAPTVENATLYWSKMNSSDERLYLKVDFNYEIEPENLEKYVSITQNNLTVPIELQKSLDSKAVVLLLNSTINIKETIDFILNKGVVIANFTMPNDINQSLQIPSTSLEITEVLPSFDEGQGSIKVTTNSEIKPELLAANVIIESSELLATGKPKLMPLKFDLMDNGFIIRSSFTEGNIYTLRIKKGLESKLNSKLATELVQEIVFGQRPSEINFNNKKSMYLSANGNKNIALQVVNTPKVEVKIAKLFDNNILPYIKTNRYQNYSGYYDDESGETTPSAGFNYELDRNEDYSNMIFERKFDTRGLPKSGGSSVLSLNQLGNLGQKGVFLISVVSEQDYWVKDTRLVSISDIGLITKISANSLFVFANSINTATAQANVEITLISKNNQKITTGKTDEQGVVQFQNLKELIGNHKLGMVTARTTDDFNFMVLDGSEVETSRFEVEGKHENTASVDAFIYGERNIYRPGETINMVTVLRDNLWKSQKDIPLKARLLMPNGKEYFTAQKNTNEQGGLEFNITTDKNAVTGLYTFEILSGSDVLLASKNVNIEEFMPDRIKVDLKLSQENYLSTEEIKASAQVNHMYGPAAINLNYEMELRVDKALFKAKKYPNYNFEINKNQLFENELHEGKTLADGTVNQTFSSHKNYKDMGMLEAKLYLTVFDESARPVNRLKRFNIYTQPVFYGIKTSDYYVGTNTPVLFDIVALNKDQQAVTASPIVEIVQNEYQTVLQKNDGGYSYVSKKIAKSIIRKKLNLVNGLGNFTFTPQVSGDYDLRVYPEGAQYFTEQNFYAYRFGNTQSTAFEVNNEGNVEITFDREKYQVGETVTALFKTPFAGKILVTVEKNKVFEYHYIDTDKKSAEFKFKLSDEQLPNFYVSATLFRPMNSLLEMPLTVAHGYAFADVENPKLQLPVTITAIEKSRSNTKQKIAVKTGAANAYVSIAVVDEGILQLKNFRTPDIHGYYYQKQALDVKSFDIYPFLFPEIEMSSLSYTGGDGYDLEKRVNPLSNGRVELVSQWSGLIKTNAAGEASFVVDIPQFTGELRIMAVAFKDNYFGSAEQYMKVADPLIINSALPRFLSPGDQLTMPVAITNTTKQAMKAVVYTQLTGGLEATSPSRTAEIVLPAEREIRTSFSIKAPNNASEAEVLVVIDGAGEDFRQKTKITVRPAASLYKTFTSGIISGEKTETLSLGKEFLENSVQNNLVLSNSPLVKMTAHVRDLIGYPHGCAEQTISKAFPQIYFADFAKEINYNLISKSNNSDFNPNKNVQLAADRLESFLCPDGGIGLWQGSPNANGWATAYGAHFLIEAEKAGFDVRKSLKNKLLAYISSSNNSDKTEENISYYNAAGQIRVQTVAKAEIIYNLYVLALAGNPQKSLMNHFKQKQDKLTISEKYLLAAAYKQLGDQNSSQTLMPKAFVEEKRSGFTYNDFYSPIRNMALSLNAMLDTDAGNLQIPVLARQLSALVEKTKTLNTQEQSFAFLALGKYAKSLPENKITASVSAGGKGLADYSSKIKTYKAVGPTVNITTKGRGDLYYFVSSEGLSKTGKIMEEDKNIKIRRSYYTREGKAIANNTFTQNQLIVVKLTLSAANEIPIKDIVITDILPAGLEIENPRIAGDRTMSWKKTQGHTTHLDIRDDRINLFVDAGKAQDYYYLARAVSKGKFVLGPVSADAMYSAETRSYNGAGVVLVQ